METSKEFNKELREEVSKTFADLYKEIGNNREQLANKVLSLHKGINKELNKDEVNEDRKKEIRFEVSRIVKMAAQQLPHLKMMPPKPVAAILPRVVAPQAKPAPQPKAAPQVKVTAPPVKKVAPPAKKVTPPAKKVAPAAKKSTPPAKKQNKKKK